MQGRHQRVGLLVQPLRKTEIPSPDQVWRLASAPIQKLASNHEKTIPGRKKHIEREIARPRLPGGTSQPGPEPGLHFCPKGSRDEQVDLQIEQVNRLGYIL